MNSKEKPKVVQDIEALLGKELNPAPKLPSIIYGLMAVREGKPKYALNEEGQLIGLNLAKTNLTDEQWHKIVDLIEKEGSQILALNLSDNELRELKLPSSVLALQKLEVDNNPIKNLPKETLEEGNAAILNFFKQTEEQEGSVPLYEAKLLIVGEPGAGKTTLLKKLINPNYKVPVEGDKKIESTVGINIHEGWDFVHLEKKDIIFKANLWDFGGQEIQYMTHHFFLTPRALYVLVADDRKQNTEFDYWFRIINLLGKESEGEKISVLVILNEINHISVSNFFVGKYRQDYPAMDISVREVDFSVEDNRSDDVSFKIQRMLCKLPQIGDLLPRLWIPIREDLLLMREKKPHISFSEFAAICSKDRKGMRLDKEEDQRFLSRYLHRLGVMLHYQEDDLLDNFVILDPQWAVDAVYSVLKDKRVVENKGRFTKEDLKDFWNNYKREERGHLLSLMLKDRFEICYHSSPDSEEYIAPQLLPNQPPEFKWDSANAMKFRYQYPFMPKGLISRLIVRLSDLIAVNGTIVWDEGVVIERNGSEAKIIQEKTIEEGLEVLEIELCGATHERKYLLRHIITEIDKIHEKSFKHISFERMIPCICEFCKGDEQPTFFKYTVLLQYQEEEWEEIDCSKVKLKKVSVTALLEGVFPKAEGIERGKGYHFHFNIDPGNSNDFEGLKKEVGHIKENTDAILSKQEHQQKYLDTLLIYAERHRMDIETTIKRLDETKIEQRELIRINDLLEDQLDKYFAQLSPGMEIVEKWKETKTKLPHQPDAKWKIKLKLPFIFGEIEKELSFDTKAAIKLIRREIKAFMKGEKTFKQLFIEDDED